MNTHTHARVFHPTKPAPAGSTAAIVRQAINAAGGPKDVAARLSRRLQAVYDMADPNTVKGLRYDDSRRLTTPENRVFAEDLAQLAGCYLVPFEKPSQSLNELAAASAKEHGEFLAAVIGNTADKSELIRELDEVISVLTKARAALTATNI